MLSIVIPSYNEAQRLPKTLQEIRSHFTKTVEVIVVDDGSTDQTHKYVKAPHKVIRLKQNQGKGAAVQSGVAAAKGSHILIMDADSATPIQEIHKLLAFKKDFPIVIGSRYMPSKETARKQPFYRKWIGRMGRNLIRSQLNLDLHDTQCGFKLFENKTAKALFKELQNKSWGFDFEILYKAKNKKIPIKEVPVAWIHQEESRLRPIKAALSTYKELKAVRRIDQKPKK